MTPAVSRRAMLSGALAGAAALALPSCSKRATPAPAKSAFAALLDELDAKITAAMKAYAIPGAAVGVWASGQQYVRG